LPLGDSATRNATVEMTNLIGICAAEAAGVLADPAAHLHFYGKAEARKGRKMGHVTKVS
jgi:5-(carboxyamino)imidazole ribonucleotide synthase